MNHSTNFFLLLNPTWHSSLPHRQLPYASGIWKLSTMQSIWK